MMNFLEDLNKEQQEAVLQSEGPVMVLAGAGSGKTRVLTYKVAYLIHEHLADAFNILALTFTNKASGEMRSRIEKLIGNDARNVWMGTFHSVFAKILRVEAEKLGYTRSFTIYDSEDSKTLVKTIIREMNLDDKIYKPSVIFNRISSAKNALISPEEFPQYATDDFGQKTAQIYKTYCERCFKSNAMDFDDLLVKPIQLFNNFPETLYKYQQKFKYVLIDEFQDTNPAQYLMAKKLASVRENICVVGDDAQSIYAFRGANIENILGFQRDYTETKVFKLEQNYRSTKNILELANSIIVKNTKQLPKKLWTANDHGELIYVMTGATENDEAQKVVDSIRDEKMRNNFFNREFAVLYRTNAQSRAMEESLRRANIPYRVISGISFYQRKEIKDLIAYLRLTVNPNDEEAVRRVINYPARGIGQTSMEKLTVFAKEKGISLWDSLVRVKETDISPRTKSEIENFVTKIKSYSAMLDNRNAYEIANHIAQTTGILKDLHDDQTVEGLSRWENVQELLNGIKEFCETYESEDEDKSLGTFLQQISLLTDADKKVPQDEDCALLMTIHAAKGLEFPVVYVIGLEENLFPSQMSLQDRGDLEEERRLFYVAITRTKKKLFLSYARSRYRYGTPDFCEPSRFLEELDQKYLHYEANYKRERSYETYKKTNGEFRETSRVLGVSHNRKLTPIQIAESSSVAIAENFIPDNLENLMAGMRVKHGKFGEGKVLTLEGKEDGRKAIVFFKDKGQKTLLLKYARLKIIE